MSEKEKPREWWIQNPVADIATATRVSAYDEEVNPEIYEEIHVIEKAAFDALAAENERLREKLGIAEAALEKLR